MNYKKILSILVLIFLFVFSTLEIIIIKNQNIYKPVKSDAIIILGHSVDDKNIPSPWLIKRLENGLQLYNDGYAPVIIVTGSAGPSDNITVAKSMKDWLVLNGVKDENIIEEKNAKNTYENFKFSKKIADNYNINSVIFVTNEFHMYRSNMIGNYFFNEISGSGSYTPISINKIFAYVKEPFSVVLYKFVHIIETYI